MKVNKALWFGFSLMGLVVAGAAAMLLSVEQITYGHIGLLMLSLVVVAIMLGFPTAFTLMGMGMLFTWLAYDRDITRTLDLMVQSAFKVMGNDVLIAIPLFVFMGYLVERANLPAWPNHRAPAMPLPMAFRSRPAPLPPPVD